MNDMYFNGFDKSKFNEDQWMIVEQGEDFGLSMEAQEVYADPTKYNWMQMYELQQGLVDGLTISQVRSFADPSLSHDVMHLKRKEMEQLLGLNKDNAMLLDDRNVRNVLEILQSNGMNQEANDYLALLCQLDIMSSHCKNQEKELIQLENEVRSMKKPTLKERAEEVVEAAKRDLNELKEKLNEIKDTIKRESKFLYETFKVSGKLAFCKAFSEFASGLKYPIRALRGHARADYERTKKSIEVLSAIREETKSAGTHLKNVGRMLLGRRPKEIEEDTHAIGALGAILPVLKRHKRIVNRQDVLFKKCLRKLDSLEKSFGAMAKENKRDLKDLISEAAAESAARANEKGQKKEHEWGR